MDSSVDTQVPAKADSQTLPGAGFVRGWLEWWRNLSGYQKALPVFCAVALWGGYLVLGGFRPDHLNLGLVILALGYLGPFARRVLEFLTPLLLTAVVYDTQRYYSDFIRGRIRVEEPYLFDKIFFGINTASGVLTPNEWLQLHTTSALDFITGLAYLIFIAVFVTTSAYFVFHLVKKGTPKMGALAIRRLAPGVMWSFFWLNVLGYSTYYWYPAAPPWYVTLHGLGPARLDVPANPAGCARFDELLGTHFFTGMYGRSADVFGAIPSLHVAYPLLTVLFAFQFGALRGFSIFFYLLMCFSAVYLNHHYILDIIWGSAYTVLIWWLTCRFFRTRAPRARSLT